MGGKVPPGGQTRPGEQVTIRDGSPNAKVNLLGEELPDVAINLDLNSDGHGLMVQNIYQFLGLSSILYFAHYESTLKNQTLMKST